ncbi:hypothetical protein FHL15_005394 [Xylaria flabelliformis]|uniref:Uncharacterized protein n=1 Tax=Xylaria flabelliformis TaxID=2512241 RepID=A0A553I0I4_9PEZI|nr:hypothetical protein FHL15_005394 [Xylaria flabelliformis]
MEVPVNNVASVLRSGESPQTHRIKLDPVAFARLRSLVQVGEGLPDSIGSFRNQYWTKSIDKSFAGDPSLFDAIGYRFAEIHNNCHHFKFSLDWELSNLGQWRDNPPPFPEGWMLTAIGATITLLADQANDFVISTSQVFKLMKSNADNINLIEIANKIIGSSEPYIKGLKHVQWRCERIYPEVATFKVKAKQDMDGCLQLRSRWNSSMPSDQELDRRIKEFQETCAQLERAAEQKANEAQAREIAADTVFKPQPGYTMFKVPGVSWAALLVEHASAPMREHLKRDAERLRREYDELVESDGTELNDMKTARANLQLLITTLTTICDSASEVQVSCKQLENIERLVGELVDIVQYGGELGGLLEDFEIDEQLEDCRSEWEELQYAGKRLSELVNYHTL